MSLKVSNDLIDIFYPVGCYIETSSSTFNPNVKWGGVWKEDTPGLCLVAIDTSQSEFNTLNKIGGSKYLQKHTHVLSAKWFDGSGSHNHGSNVGYVDQASSEPVGANGYSNSTAIQETGAGTSGNLQPYKIIKRWHRIS